MPTTPKYTVPGLDIAAAAEAAAMLQDRLVSLVDLSLTLKHIHWNVVGPMFVGVHEMLDPQHAGVSAMVDAVAERIATLGGEPNGLPGNLVATRRWNDYSQGRAQVPVHLRELDRVYEGVIGDHRQVAAKLAEIDPVSEDLLIGHTGDLELYQWFVRAHLESTDGSLERGSADGSSGPAPAERRTAAATS
ncbi:MAG: DNA starvation/stationary phase protection protein [Acidimicrobiia bacterium]|nr:DNA starvation/stationary phase protection protein [Acidimicrobiia bacterium]